MVARFIAVAASVWVASLIAAPELPGSAGALLYGLGSLICHQIPERSFHLAGFQLPVCARCLGLYVGGSAGGASHLWLWAARARNGYAQAASRRVRWLAGAAAAPTLLTVVIETAGVWAPSNATRAIAAVPLGGVLGLVVMRALATLHYDGCEPRAHVPTPPPPPV